MGWEQVLSDSLKEVLPRSAPVVDRTREAVHGAVALARGRSASEVAAATGEPPIPKPTNPWLLWGGIAVGVVVLINFAKAK